MKPERGADMEIVEEKAEGGRMKPEWGADMEILEPEVMVRRMLWKCLDCREGFLLPINRYPANGCPQCGSQHVLDMNATPVRRKLYSN